MVLLFCGDIMKKKNVFLWIIMFLMLVQTINVSAASCSDTFSPKFMETLRNNFFRPVKIVAPILLLLFTSFDFAKAVFNDNKDGLNKAMQNFLKRAIATLVVFFAPNIIELILSFINTRNMNACLNSIK